MEKAEKLLMGIENVLGMASELFNEVARLKQVEEECKILKEKLFMSQFTRSEKEVFELALDGLSSSKNGRMVVQRTEHNFSTTQRHLQKIRR
ncbi:LuxR family transcriptional regulator [Priestia megaterium]|uniref:LuxR family transcriptional regulator n=1 Tax=Priestia megaterium TaxID=1404 RepID=UPI0038793DCE